MYAQQQYQSVLLPQQRSTIQKLLDDNSELIALILDSQAKGEQTECLEYQQALYRNLTYLTQFDPTTSHYPNHLPPPDTFIQPPGTNGSAMSQTASDQIYRRQTNSPTSVNTAYHSTNINPHSSSASIQHSLNTLAIPQQRSSHSLQQNGYEQYPTHRHHPNPPSSSPSIISNSQMYHPQQNYLMQQQWQNQSRTSMQQQPHTPPSQQHVPPHA